MSKKTSTEKRTPGSLHPAGSARSSVFFTADVSETVDYVLDQAAMYADRKNFIAAVMKGLKPWRDEAPNND